MSTEPESIALPTPLLNGICDYLALKPWGEVNPMMQGVGAAIRAEQAKAAMAAATPPTPPAQHETTPDPPTETTPTE